jgi:RNA polymerase sigma-70 factor (ECF subfamily)
MRNIKRTKDETGAMERVAARLLDEYLAAAARAGDRAAFGRLAGQWQPKLLAHAWRLTGDPELARDVVQDAWTDIARGLHRLGDVAVFPAWAYRIVSRRAVDAIDRRVRARRLSAAMDVPAGTVKTRLMHARTRLRAALTGENDNGRA